MTKTLCLAACLACAGTFAAAQSIPLNSNVQGGSGSEVEVGQAGAAALAGSLGTGGIVAIAAVVVVVAAVASDDDDNASTTTTN